MTYAQRGLFGRSGFAVLAALAVGTVALPAAAQAPDIALGRSVADIVEDLFDSVVNIATSQRIDSRAGLPPPQLPEDSPFRDFFNDELAPLREVESLGSGFVIDAAGIVVTNHHVIDGADRIWVVLNDGSRLAATLIGYDPPTDLAVLRVEPPRPLTALSFGDSEALRIGDPVIAIGNPFGLGGTVTLGILSARNRDINSGPFDDYLQTDASINRGNSGGPLFNLAGEVVGVNTAILSDTGESIGIAFAVPSLIAANVVGQLVATGAVERGRIGLQIQDVSDGLAEGFGIAEARGALVVGYSGETSPGELAGIEVGDIILSFAGQRIEETRDLFRIVAATPVGSTADAVLLRDGAQLTLPVVLGAREDEFTLPAPFVEAEREALPTPLVAGSLGLTVAAITDELRDRYDIEPAIAGVVITRVALGSPAAERDFETGEVIVEVGVGGETVVTPEDVDRRLAQEQAAGRGAVVLLIATPDGGTRFEWIRLDG